VRLDQLIKGKTSFIFQEVLGGLFCCFYKVYKVSTLFKRESRPMLNHVLNSVSCVLMRRLSLKQ